MSNNQAPIDQAAETAPGPDTVDPIDGAEHDQTAESADIADSADGTADSADGTADSADGTDDSRISPLRKVIAETAERTGLNRFEPELGDRFDPEHHEAVAALDTGAETELVIGCVVRPGYRIGSRVFPAAEVTVAAPDSVPEGDGRR